MTLSIIILNYKQKNLTRETVKGILDLDLQFDYEIIVVDNNSQDGLGKLVRSLFPNVKFIQSDKNLGMGAGNNLGIRQARGKYILILNPDAVVFKSSLEPLIDFLERNPLAGIVAPQILDPDRSWQASAYKFPKFLTPLYRRTALAKTQLGQEYLREYIITQDKLKEPTRVDWVLGAVFMIKKQIIDQLGNFDERFFLFFEDTDLCRRVWNTGYEVWYIPQAKVVHYPHRLSAHELGLLSLFNKNTYPHIASWLKYFWKWHRR